MKTTPKHPDSMSNHNPDSTRALDGMRVREQYKDGRESGEIPAPDYHGGVEIEKIPDANWEHCYGKK